LFYLKPILSRLKTTMTTTRTISKTNFTIGETPMNFTSPDVPYKNMSETFEKLNLTMEQKRGIIVELYKDEHFMDRKIRRRGEFIHAFQKVIFRHYPLLDTLSSNGWIGFSALMHGEFFECKYHFDILSTFIAFKLPEEDIHLTHGELQKKFDVIYQEMLSMEQNKP
jgi:hypothetical protein